LVLIQFLQSLQNQLSKQASELEREEERVSVDDDALITVAVALFQQCSIAAYHPSKRHFTDLQPYQVLNNQQEQAVIIRVVDELDEDWFSTEEINLHQQGEHESQLRVVLHHLHDLEHLVVFLGLGRDSLRGLVPSAVRAADFTCVVPVVGVGGELRSRAGVVNVLGVGVLAPVAAHLVLVLLGIEMVFNFIIDVLGVSLELGEDRRVSFVWPGFGSGDCHSSTSHAEVWVNFTFLSLWTIALGP